MLQQECEFNNPFVSFSADVSEFEQLYNMCLSNDDDSCNSILSGVMSIKKNYQKLNETYQDIKKLANTYIDSSNTQQTSQLASKLNRYYP